MLGAVKSDMSSRTLGVEAKRKLCERVVSQLCSTGRRESGIVQEVEFYRGLMFESHGLSDAEA